MSVTFSLVFFLVYLAIWEYLVFGSLLYSALPWVWEWEYDFLLWGSPYGYPYGYPHMDIHMGIPTEILWEWDGSGSGNSLPTATLIILHYFYSLLTIFVRAI